MSKSSELDRKAKVFILSCLDHHPETGEPMTINESIKYINDRFTSEYGWYVERVGRQQAMISWLQGLALPIPFMNCDIIELAIEWGSIPSNATEKDRYKILDNYWQLMAAKTLQLIDGYRVPKK